MSLHHYLKTWLAHQKHNKTASHDITIGITSTVTTDPIAPYVGCYLLEKGYKNPKIEFAEFNQIHQTCRNHQLAFQKTPDVIFCFWRFEDIASPGVEYQKIEKTIKETASSLKALAKNYNGLIITCLPSLPGFPYLELLSINSNSTEKQKFQELQNLWKTLFSEDENVKFLDVDSLIFKIGFDKVYAPGKWFLYKQPYSEEFWHLAGNQLGRIIHAQTNSAKKCIVVDADNTLWGGIIGEDGLGGIQLGNEFPGSAFKAFQQSLLYFKNKGLMLAVASKNNEPDCLEALEKHDDMLLKKEDFVALEVNWNSKVEHLKNIAQKLNIGTNALVFIDDNSKEIGEIQERLPEVTCLQVPENIEELPYLLNGTDLFDIARLTEEDSKRNEMMHANNVRQELSESMSEEEFRHSLKLEMEVFKMEEQHLGRMTQLINKTNQFNLSAIRRAQNEVKELGNKNNTQVLGMKLRDKYGDYGLVGVAILEFHQADKECLLDTFLMSCRALGRGAEKAFLSAMSQICVEKDIDIIKAEYIPTSKNGMIIEFLKQAGFQEKNSKSIWVGKVKNLKVAPAYIQVIFKS